MKQKITKDSGPQRTLKNPTNIIFFAAISTILLITLVTFSQFREFIAANKWVMHTYDVILTTQETLTCLSYLESRQRAYLLYGDKDFPQYFDEHTKQLYALTAELIDLTRDNSLQHARVLKLSDAIKQRVEILKKLADIKQIQPPSSPQALILFTEGKTLSETVRLSASEIIEIETVLLEERNSKIVKVARITNIIFFFAQALSIISLLFAFLLFNRELRKRWDAEKNIRTVESQLRGIIEGASDMIAALDMNRKYITFNKAYQKEFKKIFGKRIEIGMGIEEALSEAPEDKEKLLSSWKKSLAGEEFTHNTEFKINGETKTYEVTSSLMKDENEDTLGAVHIIRNVSERTNEQNKLKKAYEDLNAGLNELQDKNDKITLLLEMSDVMLTCASTKELSEVAAKYGAKVLSFASGQLYVMHPSRDMLENTGTWGTPSSNKQSLIQEDCWALRLGHIHRAALSSAELLCNHVKTNKENIAYFCIPLRAQNDIFGLLYLEVTHSSGDEIQLANNEKLVISAFAELLALSLANVRLRENLHYQSIRDPLTALFNRRYLEEFLTKQIHQSERTGLPIALLMLDLDHFKKTNDMSGHDAGDMVLKEFGDLLTNEIRPGDLAARYGGEEFIVVLYNTEITGAKQCAENIRKKVAMLRIRYGAQDIGTTTVSIGIAAYPVDAKSQAELIECADKALYFAKNNGRNRVVLFSDIA